MDFKLHSEFKPTGDQPQAIKKLVDGFKEGNQLLHLAHAIQDIVVTRLSNTDTTIRHPYFYSRIGQHVKESLKDTALFLMCSHGIDG